MYRVFLPSGLPKGLLCGLLCSLLLGGCDAPTGPPARERDAEPAASVIGDPLEQSLSKAQSVEDLSGQRKDTLDEAVDNAD